MKRIQSRQRIETIMENKGDKSDAPKSTLIEAVSIRSVSLVILASIASLYFIGWAQAVLLPLVVAVLVSYALDPLVSTLDHIKIPRPLSAAIILLVLLGAIAGASIPLQTEVIAILDKVPVAISKFQRNETDAPKQEESIMEKAQAAAKKIEDSATQEKKDKQPDHQRITPVRVMEKPTDVQDYALKSAPAVLVLVSQLFSVLLLVFFILAVGPLYKRKIVKISGPSFARMRTAARIMNEFHYQVRRFLFVMLLGGLFVGILTWLAFMVLGVEQALFWGVVAGFASAVPYLGPFLVFIGTGIAAFIQFGEINTAIIVAGTSLAITSIQGYLLTPWLTSQVSTINPVAIFVGLLFWGWLWGPVGLIIATPILMIIKSLCDHVINLRPVGELLGK